MFGPIILIFAEPSGGQFLVNSLINLEVPVKTVFHSLVTESVHIIPRLGKHLKILNIIKFPVDDDLLNKIGGKFTSFLRAFVRVLSAGKDNKGALSSVEGSIDMFIDDQR